ncbi:MAG TPA: DUF1552 domain-containing protein [Polyangiaceae bacterium]|nr:DUF1552 domain-containing protein [Polyangiaceae bacterium]
MSKFTLSRRTVLRGAGTIAIALPWLEVMGTERAHAQTAGTPLKRFITVYQPGGTVREGAIGDKYTPTGSESSFTLSPILAPFEPFKSRLLIADGLDCKCGDQAQFQVEQHQGGGMGWLTGAIQPGANNLLKAPSIDQILAARLSAGKAFSSLEVAVRWATGKSHGKLHPINALYFAAAAPYGAIPPRLDPQDIFKTLFGSTPTTGGGVDVALERKKSILDFVDKKYVSLSAKLGTSDRAKLDQHLTQIRDLENRLKSTSTTPPTVACKAPTKVDTTGYNPSSGLNSSDTGSILDLETDKKIPDVGKFMMDMLVMALACDKTGVASLDWSDTEAKHTFPWLNLSEHHHFYQHDGGFKPTECAKIATWYSEMHAYFLQKLQAVDMGGHTLLDETLLFFGTEISRPDVHSKKNMPYLVAGGDGKIVKTGRWVKFGGVPHNRLLTSLLNAYGDTRTKFGDDRVDSAALSLT